MRQLTHSPLGTHRRHTPASHTGVAQVRLIERLFPGSSKVELSKMHAGDSGEISLVLKGCASERASWPPAQGANLQPLRAARCPRGRAP